MSAHTTEKLVYMADQKAWMWSATIATGSGSWVTLRAIWLAM